MRPTLEELGIDSLSPEDRFALAQALWDSLVEEFEGQPITPALRAELLRRAALADAEPTRGKRSADVTHNHEEGVRGAQAVAAAVFLARTGKSKKHIRRYVETQFGYFLDDTLEQTRPTYRFDVSCQWSVPQSIVAFLESTDFEDAVRNAISLGGDADTMACIAGAIAEPFYGGVPAEIADPVLARLDDRLRGIVHEFCGQYGGG
ncbi:MAG: ADP-ribosylglycohydrolase family protein [Gemmataceae bacterium]